MRMAPAGADSKSMTAGVVRADEARSSVQRIKNLLNDLHVYETDNIEWEHNHDQQG